MKQWLPDGDYAIISKKLYNRKSPLLWAWREEPSLDNDSGWRMVSSEDNQETLQEEEPYYVTYTQLLAIEPTVSYIFGYPVGADFQLVRDQGKKYYVYNDTFETVQPIQSDRKLPTEDRAFKNHFQDFLKDQNQPVQVSNKQLETLHYYVDHWRELFDFLLEDRKDQPSKGESYILTGLGLGSYQAIVNSRQTHANPHLANSKGLKTKDMVVHTYRTFLHETIGLSMDEAEAYIHQYLDHPGAPEQQILTYGGYFEEWLQKGDRKRVKEEYQGLTHHYLNPEASD